MNRMIKCSNHHENTTHVCEEKPQSMKAVPVFSGNYMIRGRNREVGRYSYLVHFIQATEVLHLKSLGKDWLR